MCSPSLCITGPEQVCRMKHRRYMQVDIGSIYLHRGGTLLAVGKHVFMGQPNALRAAGCSTGIEKDRILFLGAVIAVGRRSRSNQVVGNPKGCIRYTPSRNTDGTIPPRRELISIEKRQEGIFDE